MPKAITAKPNHLPDVAFLLAGAIGVRDLSSVLPLVQNRRLGEIFVLPHRPTLAERIGGVYPLIDGAAVIGHGSPRQFTGLLPPAARLVLAERFAHLHYLALGPKERGKGKSTPLIVAAIRWALQHEYRYLVAGSWYSSVSKSSGDLLTAAGAEVVGAGPMRTLSSSRDCPKCFAGECHCQAIVYQTGIDPESLQRWIAARRSTQR
jgi:GNAT superfamily N-acetyltransferase